MYPSSHSVELFPNSGQKGCLTWLFDRSLKKKAYLDLKAS